MITTYDLIIFKLSNTTGNEGIEMQFSMRRNNDGLFVWHYSEASDPVLHQSKETFSGETFDEPNSSQQWTPPEG